MSLNQLKRALWMMNELVNSGQQGISRVELSRRWSRSSLNEKCEPDLPERTFFRLRRDLQDLFSVEIICSSDVEKRYSIQQTEYSILLGLLCRLVTDNSRQSISINDLLVQVLNGLEITEEENKMIKAIAFKLDKIPYETGRWLIEATRTGQIEGANKAQWSEFEWHRLCIWYENTYQRFKTWVGVHITHNGKDNKGEVRLYIVNETQDAELHGRLIKALDLSEGETLGGGYRWFAPRNESLYCTPYVAFPDLSIVKSKIEILLSRLNSFSKKTFDS